MKWERSDEEYYEEATDLFSASRSKEVLCASKTPTLVLPSELHTQNRRDYYDALVKGIRQGKLKVQYGFAREPTVKRLEGLFSEDPAIQENFRDHIQELQNLIQYKMLDLRVLPTADFISGLVSDSLGMLHFKDPNTLETITVDFVTDKDLIEPQKRFQEILRRAKRVDGQVLQNIIDKAREEYILSSVATVLHLRSKDAELTLEEIQLVSMAVQEVPHLRKRITEKVEDSFDTNAALYRIPKYRADYIKVRILKPLLEFLLYTDTNELNKTLEQVGIREKGYEVFISGAKKEGEFSRRAIDRCIAEKSKYHIFFFEDTGKVFYKDTEGNMQEVDMKGNILPQRLLSAFLRKRFGEVCKHSYLISEVWEEKEGKGGVRPTSVDLHQLVRRLHKLTNYALKEHITARKGGFRVKEEVQGCLIRRKSLV